MKILISADMEGTCGVTSWVQVTPPELGETPSSTAEYERARLRMTHEVNAAIEGALEGGATDIIVNDAHDGMRNLIPEALHKAARFISGADKAFGMVQGVQTGVDGIFFTGYHAKAGTPAAPLAHTWTGYLQDVRFNGVSTGEYGINAAIAGHFDVPVVLVTGDDKAVAQTRALLGDSVVGVAVKEGYTTFSALHLHPEVAQAKIREGAKAAMQTLAAGNARPYRLPEACEVALEFDHQARADQCCYLPGVTRTGERSVGFRATDALAMNQLFRALMKVSGIRMSP
jgi:D-amino peptidase